MNRINIVFDIKVLIDGLFDNENRVGVYFVAWNILNFMKKNKHFCITLAYPLEHKNTASLNILKKDIFFSCFMFVCSGAGELKSFLIEKINKHKKNKKYLKMIYNYLLLLKSKLKENIYCNKNNFKYSHIYLSTFYAIPHVILKQKHIKCFVVLYDTIPLIFPEYFGCNTGYHRMLSMLNKNIYSFCISQSCKDDYLKFLKDKLDENKMFVTYISTNQDYFPNYDKQELENILNKYNIEYNQNVKYLFSLCSLEPRKNLLFTIECFIKFIIKHDIKDLYFYLGGGAWTSFNATMKETMEKAGEFKNKIKLLGYVEDSDLNLLYSNSLFFTYLSEYEGFGMPPLEAMQAGTPVITSNNSSLPEVVGDAAITLTYNDEAAVIKAFEDLYFNENLRNEYIEKGLKRAKMFSWDKCVGKMADIMINKVNNETCGERHSEY